jgi:hypothetical protein
MVWFAAARIRLDLQYRLVMNCTPVDVPLATVLATTPASMFVSRFGEGEAPNPHEKARDLQDRNIQDRKKPKTRPKSRCSYPIKAR